MLLEDFLKQCVLLRATCNFDWWTSRGRILNVKGAIFIASRYQQWQSRQAIFRTNDGAPTYHVDHYRYYNNESVFVFPYLKFLEHKRGYHLNRYPFSTFISFTLKNFELLYPDINTITGHAKTDGTYPITRFTAKTPLKTFELENKNGQATAKAITDQTVLLTE